MPPQTNAQPWYLSDVTRLEWQSGNVAPGSIAFLGDSLTCYGDFNQVSPAAWNAGVGGERIDGILNRLARLPSLRTAGGVCLHAGVNDINAGAPIANMQANMASLLNWLSGPLIVTLVTHQTSDEQRQRTDDLNSFTYRAAAARGNCRVIDLNAYLCGGRGGLLLSKFTVDGRLHYSGAAYAIWYPLIRNALAGLI